MGELMDTCKKTITPTDSVTRDLLLNAYHPDNFYYYHMSTKKYDSGFIDGMAWNSLGIAAAHLVGDTELEKLMGGYLYNLVMVGPDSRNYAPEKVGDNWVQSPTVPGYWYKKKPQSSAGPLGMYFANRVGANVKFEGDLKKKAEASLQLTKVGFPFGVAVRYVSGLRQHINTMFMAYLAKGKKPPFTMSWVADGNPFFSYIFGKKCEVEYPPLTANRDGRSVTQKKVVPLKDRKPCSWIFRIYPNNKYIQDGELLDQSYTPIFRVVADYLQSTL